MGVTKRCACGTRRALHCSLRAIAKLQRHQMLLPRCAALTQLHAGRKDKRVAWVVECDVLACPAQARTPVATHLASARRCSHLLQERVNELHAMHITSLFCVIATRHCCTHSHSADLPFPSSWVGVGFNTDDMLYARFTPQQRTGRLHYVMQHCVVPHGGTAMLHGTLPRESPPFVPQPCAADKPGRGHQGG